MTKEIDGAKERNQLIAKIWRDNRWLYSIVGFFVGLVAFPLIYALNENSTSFLGDLVPEIIGILIAVFFIDRIYASHEHDREKQKLIRQMGSLDNGLALQAIRELMVMDAIYDGSLVKVMLPKANLQEALLVKANMKEAILYKANLSKVILSESNLQEAMLIKANLRFANLQLTNLEGATLRDADLRGSRLSGANLRNADLDRANFSNLEYRMTSLHCADLENADLENANLKGAFMYYANLRGASLSGASLEGANLHSANLTSANLSERSVLFGETTHTIKPATFDEKTTLPDGTYWTSETNLARFTDSEHPDYWTPPHIKCPDLEKEIDWFHDI